MSAAAAPSARFEDQRRDRRAYLSVPGKIFVPAEETTLDCEVIDLSAGGAGVKCGEFPPAASYVVLYAEGFGRFEAVVMRVVDGVLGLRFVCSDAKIESLIEKLKAYVETGSVAATALRSYRRLHGASFPQFTRVSGERVDCEVLDISLTGALLKTRARLAQGEMILIGQLAARVVRQEDDCFGVVFAH